MLPVVVAIILSAGGSGTPSSQPLVDPVITPHHVFVTTGSMPITFVAQTDMELTAMHWVTTGLGVGVGVNQTVSVVVNGVVACSIVTACTLVVGSEASQACSASIPSGADVDVTRTGCALGLSSGTLTYLISQ